MAVATVLTVYGIETESWNRTVREIIQLQQCLPFTVLKPPRYTRTVFAMYSLGCNSAYRLRY